MDNGRGGQGLFLILLLDGGTYRCLTSCVLMYGLSLPNRDLPTLPCLSQQRALVIELPNFIPFCPALYSITNKLTIQ